MPAPLTVSIGHRHGREEAARRIKAGLDAARVKFGHVFRIEEETWSGHTLVFRVTALGQSASGDIAVEEERVVLTVTLPWLLSKFAHAVQGAVKKQGTLMLEKK